MWLDPNLQRKSLIMEGHMSSEEYQRAGFPLFSLFEMSITGLCNRTCEFCPRVDPAVYPNRNENLSLDLHEKMMAELNQLEYSGIIGFSGFSEPLLHKELDQLIAISRAACPRSRLEVYTNGDFVTVEKLVRLFEAGLTSIHISLYDGPHQLEEFAKIREATGLGGHQVILRDRYYSSEEGYGLVLSNRAGMIDFKKTGVKPLTAPLRHKCFYPFYMMMVDHKGDVMLCSHDWGKKLVVGNLSKQTIVEVWAGELIRTARNRLGNADRSFLPCSGCDVKGTHIGGEHYARWDEYYKIHAP